MNEVILENPTQRADHPLVNQQRQHYQRTCSKSYSLYIPASIRRGRENMASSALGTVRYVCRVCRGIEVAEIETDGSVTPVMGGTHGLWVTELMLDWIKEIEGVHDYSTLAFQPPQVCATATDCCTLPRVLTNYMLPVHEDLECEEQATDYSSGDSTGSGDSCGS